MPARARQSGFTLIEVLVAITIFAVMSAGVYRVLSAMVETQSRIVVHADDLRALQRAMWVIASDLEQAVQRDVPGDYRERLPAMVTNEDDYALQFTRQGLRNPLLYNRSDLQRVAYSIGQPPASGDGERDAGRDRETRHLLRHVWATVDRLPDTRVQTQVLLEDVDEITLRFVDEEGHKFNKWPPKEAVGKRARQRELPISVTIVLSTRRFGEITRVFQLGNEIQIKPLKKQEAGP